MKKVLLATTALALSAGVAYAEVSISGNARMGLQYSGKVAGTPVKAGGMTTGATGTIAAFNTATGQSLSTATAIPTTSVHITALNDKINGTGAVASGGGLPDTGLKGALAAQQAARAASIAATGVAPASGPGSDASLKIAADALTAAQATLAAISGAAAVPDTAAKTTFEKRMTVTMSGSVETTSGLTFGATMNLRAAEGMAAIGSGARVHMATNGVEVAVGNIYGAIDSMPGVYSASAGLTGLGWGGLVTNTTAKGAFKWDSYSSSGNGVEGIELTYSAGAFTGHLSHSDKDLGSSGGRTAAYVSYAMGDWTVAAGMQDSTVNTEDKTVLTVGGKVGDFGVGVAYADNDGETKIALNGSATFGATTVSMYVANEESASDNPMGLGVSHDLGGASLVGGVARTASGQTRADMGVSFSF